ncbi:MAG: alpha/beta fold hydrolase [Dehalococcoidia bacterium]|nr:alpha/beta fold hydrolase [Dehalococcoidia bacterium]
MNSPCFVLVHGAYHGAWCWQKTVDALKDSGCKAYTPTLTGLGDRSYLLSSEINLSTHIADVALFMESEDLHDVILVGHSYSGMVISGVAERSFKRISCLVYLDSYVPKDGQRVFDLVPDILPRVTVITFSGRKVKVLPHPPPQDFGITDPQDIERAALLLKPMPTNCYSDPISLPGNAAGNIRKWYLLSEIQRSGDTSQRHREAYDAAVGDNWERRVIPGPHDMMVTHPAELAQILTEIAGKCKPA